MKNKLIYTGIIASIFLIAMWIYKESLTLEGIILIVVANIGSIRLLWLWLNKKEEVAILKVMHKSEFRKNQLNLHTMSHLEILRGQAQWIKDWQNGYPEQAQQVLIQQIENLDVLLKGETINPTLTPPPPPPQ